MLGVENRFLRIAARTASERSDASTAIVKAICSCFTRPGTNASCANSTSLGHKSGQTLENGETNWFWTKVFAVCSLWTIKEKISKMKGHKPPPQKYLEQFGIHSVEQPAEEPRILSGQLLLGFDHNNAFQRNNHLYTWGNEYQTRQTGSVAKHHLNLTCKQKEEEKSSADSLLLIFFESARHTITPKSLRFAFLALSFFFCLWIRWIRKALFPLLPLIPWIRAIWSLLVHLFISSSFSCIRHGTGRISFGNNRHWRPNGNSSLIVLGRGLHFLLRFAF